MTGAPSFEEIFAVMSSASVGDAAARVALPEDPQLDDTATKFAVALNLLLDDLAFRMEAFKRSQDELAATVNSIGDAVMSTDLYGKVVRMNPVAESLTGWSEAEASGRPLGEVFRIVNEDTHVEVESPVDRVLSEGIVVGLANHTVLISRDGRECAIADSGAPIRDANGAIRGVVLVFRDQTDERRAERLLRESEARKAAVMQAALDCIVVMDHSGKIIDFNPAAETTFGYARAYALGKPLADLLVPPSLRAKHRAGLARYIETGEGPIIGKRIEMNALRANGVEFPVEIAVLRINTEGPPTFTGYLRDITERRQAEEAIRVAAIVESSDDAIVGKTPDGVITSWNRGAHRLFGYSADEVIGKHIGLLVPPGRENEEAGILERLAKGDAAHFDTIRRRKDGTDVDVSVTTSPVRDAAGNVIGASEVARDITERKRIEEELRRSRDVAETASRELEAFSYSVAHDLRAPLRGINGYSVALVEDLGDKLDGEAKEFLEGIGAGAARMGQLIDALLGLSRVSRAEIAREPVNLTEMALAVIKQFRASAPARVVECVVADGLFAHGDPQLLGVLLENLLGNAWKFVSKRESARIEFGRAQHEGGWAYFVRDNGAGFDMEYAGKLFAPFQRLHKATEFAGTGIGLATVQRVVRRHGGRIWAEGAVERGATFHFTLDAPRGGGTWSTTS